MRAAGLALCLIAGPAAAQDLVFSMDATEGCLTGADAYGDKLACIGTSANACMEATPGGWSTVGMAGCLDRELGYWDGRLNAVYAALRAQEKAEDDEVASYGGTPPASQADALRDMQRAWIDFRDAKCWFERTQWGGGTGGGPAHLSCMMYETAAQTLYLISQQAN